MATAAEIRAELRRQLAAPKPAAAEPTQSVQPPTADALRALRMKWMTDAQGSASKDFTAAIGAFRDVEKNDPENPQIPALRDELARGLPDLLPPVTEEQAASLYRERARTGQPAPVGAPAAIQGAIERGARVIDPAAGLAGKIERVKAGVVSAAQYPLRALSALLRPIDAPAPAAARALIEGKDPATAAIAGADPLGRYSPAGAETGRWANPPPSWHDVTEAALKKWGVVPPGKFPGAAEAGAPGYQHPLTGKDVPAAAPAPKLADKELLGMGPAGWAGVGTAADVALSPSTGLTAFGASGKGVQVYGKTVIPDKLVTGAARFPGSVLERGAEALASRMALDPRISLQAAHRVGRAGEVLGKVGPAQLLEGAPRVAAALPLGGGKTLGQHASEAFDRYHTINQVKDQGLRAALLEIAQLRESATATQVAQWTDQVERLFKGVSPEDQRIVRDLIENPGGFDWNVRRPQMPDVPPASPQALALRPQGMERAGEPGALGGAAAQVPPPLPHERPVAGTATTTGPRYMPGDTAAPTAVPGTPDAARYGAIPNHLAGQVPTVTEAQRELAARTENVLRDVRSALRQRGLIKGRENYFPRERTRESLVQWEGEGARLEALGRGVDPRKDFRAGFQESRTEHSWINQLIDRVNEQASREAEKKGMSPNLIPHVEDTTSAVNAFWRQLPEPLRHRLTSEPERFLDKPKDELQRYLARATKSVNDFDTLQKVRALRGEAGPVARPFIREGHNGKVYEAHEVPIGGGYGRPDETLGMAPPPPAPPGAPELPRGRMGRPDERLVAGPRPPPLPGEPKQPGAFEGVPPFEKGASRTERELHGYVYPQNKGWREAFPNTALPKDVATWVDAFGKPYWATEPGIALVERLVVQPLHKAQLPWKVAATSGAGPRFAIRNYMSQQIFNLQEYGARSLAPAVQRESHLLGLPDSVFEGSPGLQVRTYTDKTGRQWTARELREAAKQTGLWRTLPEAETWSAVGGPFPQVPGPGSSAVMGWSDPKAKLSAALGKVETGVQKATTAIGPGNPLSKDFFATKHAFHPLAEYGERQGRMAALLLGLDEGMPLVEAANRANSVHVAYQRFSPTFEKYATLAYPFAKFTAGMLPNQARWALQAPGRTMFTEHLLRGGEHVVDPQERERYASEPKSRLVSEAGGRLVGWPGTGALKEPEAGRAKGADRLPYVSLPPTADVLLNLLGAPARIAASRDRSSAAASEVLEGALPAFKFPYEWATGRNVFTGEPVEMGSAAMAPRAIQALYDSSPKLARALFGASPVVDRKTGQQYLAVPQKVALIWRYFPNVQAADLASGLMGVKRPYDNETAIALRLLGVTQVMHDPQITSTQRAFENKAEAARLRKKLESWTPARATDAP